MESVIYLVIWTSKLVSLSDAAYSTLSKMKGKGMSFSDVVMYLVDIANKKRDFTKFAGRLSGRSAELGRLKRQIGKGRKLNVNVV